MNFYPLRLEGAINFNIKKGASNYAPYLTFSIESTFYILAISFSTFVFLHLGHKHLSLQKALSSIEVGENFVTSETLDKLLSALDITAEDLFSTNEQPSLSRWRGYIYPFPILLYIPKQSGLLLCLLYMISAKVDKAHLI